MSNSLRVGWRGGKVVESCLEDDRAGRSRRMGLCLSGRLALVVRGISRSAEAFGISIVVGVIGVAVMLLLLFGKATLDRVRNSSNKYVLQMLCELPSEMPL